MLSLTIKYRLAIHRGVHVHTISLLSPPLQFDKSPIARPTANQNEMTPLKAHTAKAVVVVVVVVVRRCE